MRILITFLFSFCILSFTAMGHPANTEYSNTGSETLVSTAVTYNAWFDDNTLQVSGEFEGNKTYEVVVYDMIGSKIFTRQFVGNEQRQSFDAGRQVTPGIYIVSIAQPDDPSTRQVMKIVKH
jgi:hypothetical protein